MHNRKVFIKPSTGYQLALVEVDIDPDAERIIIIDRTNMATLALSTRPLSGILRVVLPHKYAIEHNCIVGIIDDSGKYNCWFMDGVKAQSIDLNVMGIHK